MLQQDSKPWIFYTYASFVAAVGLMVVGIFALPVDIALKAYLVMGMCFLISSNIILTKTIRDQHEANKLINRIDDLKTEKLLKDYDTAA